MGIERCGRWWRYALPAGVLWPRPRWQTLSLGSRDMPGEGRWKGAIISVPGCDCNGRRPGKSRPNVAKDAARSCSVYGIEPASATAAHKPAYRRIMCVE